MLELISVIEHFILLFGALGIIFGVIWILALLLLFVSHANQKSNKTYPSETTILFIQKVALCISVMPFIIRVFRVAVIGDKFPEVFGGFYKYVILIFLILVIIFVILFMLPRKKADDTDGLVNDVSTTITVLIFFMSIVPIYIHQTETTYEFNPTITNTLKGIILEFPPPTETPPTETPPPETPPPETPPPTETEPLEELPEDGILEPKNKQNKTKADALFNSGVESYKNNDLEQAQKYFQKAHNLYTKLEEYYLQKKEEGDSFINDSGIIDLLKLDIALTNYNLGLTTFDIQKKVESNVPMTIWNNKILKSYSNALEGFCSLRKNATGDDELSKKYEAYIRTTLIKIAIELIYINEKGNNKDTAPAYNTKNISEYQDALVVIKKYKAKDYVKDYFMSFNQTNYAGIAHCVIWIDPRLTLPINHIR